MKRIFLALTLAFWSTSMAANAAPIPKAGELPPVVAQAKSFQNLVDLLKEILTKNLPAPLLKEIEKELFPQLNNKEFAWLDTKQPFGFYALLDDKLDKCAGVLLIPVTDEKDFLKALDEQFHFKMEKQAANPGYYKVIPPDEDYPVALGLRVNKGYAYFCIGDQTAIDEKKILLPSQIISDKETAPATITVAVDRIPKGLKAVAKDLYKDKIEEETKELDPEVKPLATPFVKMGKRFLDLLCDEVKTIQIRLDSNAKDTGIEINITPIEKSSLAKAVSERKPSTNQFGSLVTKDALYYQTLQVPMFAPELADFYQTALDMGQAELPKLAKDAMIPGEVLSTIGELIKVGKATVKSGNIDTLLLVNGPNKTGEYSAVFAITMKDTDGLSKSLPNMLKGLPKEVSDLVKLNASKVGDVDVHEIDLKDVVPEPFQKLTGAKPKVHIAIGKDRGIVTFGADSLGLLKQALEAKPTEMPASTSILNGKKLNVLVDEIVKAAGKEANLGQQEIELFKMFGEKENINMMEVSIKGGDKLTVRVSMGNSYLVMMGAGAFGTVARAVPGGVAPPPPVVDPKN